MSDKKKKPPFSRREFLGTGSAAALAALFGKGAVSEAEARASAQDEIAMVKIHPAIGIARIGNSREEDGYFIGPETTDPLPTKAGVSRDFAGAIKRQAARFRIYGYNSEGKVVRELTSDEAEIEWSVHVANKKAAWYRFTAAFDIPESHDMKVIRRNASVKDRSTLIVDPGARKIAGKNQSGAGFQLEGGRFLSVPISLGELRTDGDGRLLVLGGLGLAGSPERKPVYNPDDPDTFNNADGWYDDTSDGPVRATVKYKGRTLEAEAAWVVVGPPNYAPDVVGWRTLHDMLVDTFIKSGMMAKPLTTSFAKDVLPLLQRLSNLQWVNQGFAELYGQGGKVNFDDPNTLMRLSLLPQSPGGIDTELQQRKGLFQLFRVSDKLAHNKRLWPMLYGDAYGSYDKSPRNDFILSELTILHLQRWTEGEFVNDYTPENAKKYRRISEVPIADQPAMLDKAALHFCLADAFHPGCELTWPMRWASMYERPTKDNKVSLFRIKSLPEGAKFRDWGPQLDTKEALDRKDGPLHAQGPGDLSKWMAIPWHGDTVFCRSGYEPEFDPYLPTFWPARVPNHVLSEDDYAIVMNATLTRDQRLAAFKRRESWVRNMKGNAPQQMEQMVAEFARMGIVEARPGIPNDPDFPAVMFVESLPIALGAPGGGRRGGPDTATNSERGVPKTAKRGLRTNLEKAGWENREQLEEFRRIRNRKPKARR